jgi:Raf kinase inhibitor-like YbhB/YbcL family protein
MIPRGLTVARASALASVLLLGCGGGSGGAGAPSSPPGVSVASITVTSSSFASNGPIPIEHSCDGKDVTPSLTWSSPPPGTQALVVVVDDPDAGYGSFTHFVAFDLPPELLAVKEGWTPSGVGGKAGRNDFDSVDYRGPCPPKGEQHMFAFRVYALDKPTNLPEGASRSEVSARMTSHVLGAGALRGSFGH